MADARHPAVPAAMAEQTSPDKQGVTRVRRRLGDPALLALALGEHPATENRHRRPSAGRLRARLRRRANPRRTGASNACVEGEVHLSRARKLDDVYGNADLAGRASSTSAHHETHPSACSAATSRTAPMRKPALACRREARRQPKSSLTARTAKTPPFSDRRRVRIASCRHIADEQRRRRGADNRASGATAQDQRSNGGVMTDERSAVQNGAIASMLHQQIAARHHQAAEVRATRLAYADAIRSCTVARILTAGTELRHALGGEAADAHRDTPP